MLHLIHIPRTGCYSRKEALARLLPTYEVNHRVRVSDVAEEDTPVVFLRDPVDRFMSAWGHLWPNRGPSFTRQWGSAEEMALDIDHAYLLWERMDVNLFRKQAWWCDGEAVLGRFSRMDEDMLTIFGPIGYRGPFPHINGSTHREPLSVLAQRYLRDFYADDYALLPKD